MGNTTRSLRFRWIVVIGLGLACVSVVSLAYGDPATAISLTWTAPGYAGQQAVAYDLRISTTPPGADTLAWWNAATPVDAVPLPEEAGSRQSVRLNDLPPGPNLFAAIRAQYASGQWSSISTISSWSRPQGPFLQSVSPSLVTERGETELAVRGLGLSGVEGVRFVADGVGEVAGTIVEAVGDTLLRVSADLSAIDGFPAQVVVRCAAGADTLTGWVRVRMPEPPDTEAPDPVGNLHASQVTETSVRLTWSAPTDPSPHGARRVASYEVRQLGGGPGGWSWETGQVLTSYFPGPPGASEALLIGSLVPESTCAFAMVSIDSAGNVSALSNVAEITLTASTLREGPDPVTDLVATAVNDTTVRLSWSAPTARTAEGTETAASSYEVRRLAGVPGAWSWEDGAVLQSESPGSPGQPESLRVEGLMPGSTEGFGLVSRDEAGHASRMSNIAVVVLPLPPDTTAPAAISDLRATVVEDDSVQLAWIAPADDRGPVKAYEARCWRGDPESFDWNQADTLSSPPAPVPPGREQRWIAGSVAPGKSGVFALCAVDSAGNLSAVSNLAVVDRSGEDSIPPATPANMQATGFGAGAVQVRWYAPGDDSTQGRAARYELRHAVSPVVGDWIETAEEITKVGRPKPAGKQEFVNLRGLEGGTVHLFALRAFDEVGLASPWATALVYVDGPAAASDASPPAPPDSLSAVRKPGGILLSWTASPDPDVAAYRVYRTSSGAANKLLESASAEERSFLDNTAPAGAVRYAVSAVDGEGRESRLGAVVEVAGGAGGPLARVSPQGTSWSLHISDPVPSEAQEMTPMPTVGVYDVHGRLLTWIPVHRGGSGWEATWRGVAGARGRRLPRGVFFLRVRQGSHAETHKILIR